MVSFDQWRAVYEPVYGSAADPALYEVHRALGDSPDPLEYQSRVPRAVRRALGEYYTPDELVRQVLDRLDRKNEPLLDPACGAGAFLRAAGRGATGWDINPLAVAMARRAAPDSVVEVRDCLEPAGVQFDCIAGNPPWVNWRRLSSAYRVRVEPLWKRYRLFAATGLGARLGGAMDDLSALVTYACADLHLRTGGRLAFLLPAALFQSAGGGAAFRRFELPSGLFLRVVRVEEVPAVDQFTGACIRAVISVFEKSRTATLYPVPYIREAREQPARPVSGDPLSPWIIGDDEFSDLRGPSPYVARVGAHTGGAAGVYWVDVIEDRGATLVIRNRHDNGRREWPSVTAEVERGLVHPLVRGRDLRSGRANPSLHILLPHHPAGEPVAGAEMRDRFPLTFAYFERFREAMLLRPHYRQHFARSGKPYWSMYNVGAYTFAPFRVAWREQSSTFQAAMLAPGHIADAKLVTVAVDSLEEARWLAGFLCSPRVRRFVESYTLRTQISTHVMRYLRVPPFTPSRNSPSVPAARLPDDASTHPLSATR